MSDEKDPRVNTAEEERQATHEGNAHADHAEKQGENRIPSRGANDPPTEDGKLPNQSVPTREADGATGG